MPTWLVFLGVLSVLVLVHELGHFLAARIFGIRVEEFAFGLPFTKPIFQKKWGETQYSVYPLVFGGFVKLHGEEQESGRAGEYKKNESFWHKGRKQRMIVLTAGVVMNIVLAVVVFVLLYSNLGIPSKVSELVTINAVVVDSPAATANLQPLDRVVLVAGKPVVTTSEFGALMKDMAGKPVELTIRRGETIALFEGIVEKSAQEITVSVTPRTDPPEGQGALGVSISEYPYLETEKCSVFGIRCSVGIVKAGVKATGMWIGRVLEGFRSIGQSLAAGKKPEGMAGPIGIYQLTGVVATEGFLPVLELIAILSVNLAIFNILPIPALDGGRMFFVWLEWARRKRITPELEARINTWGMAFLLGLVALISLQDVIRIWWGV